MVDESSIFLGAHGDGTTPQRLALGRANRHGLIAGATGTGKTVTLQTLAEGFSRAGVPVFVADVKGDLAGLAMAGSPSSRSHAALAERARAIGLEDWRYEASPVTLWDLLGEQGHPIRTTVSEMGPLLLARLMGLNPVQEGVLAIAFRLADDEGLLLLDLDDLQAMLAHVAENIPALAARYGNVTKQSVGAIQRQLLQLREQGGDRFFGEPALAIADLIATDERGRGVINILAADRIVASPKLYATFLLWLLSELFEDLPEIGDPDRPELVFFFDEAHLLFEDAAPALLDKIEQVVRLIRSKGVGIFFVTQNPIDVPEAVAGQLGNRVQHALRAFTPREARAIKAAAETFRPNPALDVTGTIGTLAIGEALVSLLLPDGAPSPVERVLIAPPRSRLGPLTAEERAAIRAASPVGERYDQAIDRESAEELLGKRAAERAGAAAKPVAGARKAAEPPSLIDVVVTSAARSASSSIGRQVANEIGRELFGTSRRRSGGGIGAAIVRGVLGGLLGRR